MGKTKNIGNTKNIGSINTTTAANTREAKTKFKSVCQSRSSSQNILHVVSSVSSGTALSKDD